MKINKLENTLENKARFFALYYGQYVLDWNGSIIDKGFSCVNYFSLELQRVRGTFLQLTSLLQLTDEDVKNLPNSYWSSLDDMINYYQGSYINTPEEVVFERILKSLTAADYDYLRSKGYALPWMGLSINDLVSYGWVRLKEK